MKYWDMHALERFPGPPRILSTTDATRAIALGLAAGEELQHHQVHERAWVVVISGELRFTLGEGENAEDVEAGAGFVFELEPREPHSVRARSDTRFLLLLAPWPGDGHPGPMTLDQKRKQHVQAHADEHASGVVRDATDSRSSPATP